jgi:hypothetical protein
MSKETVGEVAKHICLLYTEKLKSFVIQYNGTSCVRLDTLSCPRGTTTEEETAVLFTMFFDKKETQKFIKILDELRHMMHYYENKLFLIRLWLVKLCIVNKLLTECASNSTAGERDSSVNLPVGLVESKGQGLLRQEVMVSYCRSIRHYLSDNSHRKYDSLFQYINDICTMLIHKHSDIGTILQKISNNLESVLTPEINHYIDLDKFIVKNIKQSSYGTTIASDLKDSGDDSDVNPYEDQAESIDDEDDELHSGTKTNFGTSTNNFEFTPEDLAEDSDDIGPLRPKSGGQNSLRMSRKGQSGSRISGSDEIEV